MKKFLWSLSIVSMLGLASCGSDEAKELLQRVLRLVGIPQSVVMNICQDSNNNDFCESVEVQAKVTLNKGDSMATIWEKITQTAEGQYLLETATPCTPILLELQDSDIEYDDGKFTLKYSGVEFGETSKELSVLEAMVDGQYISSYSVKSIKELNSTETQNSFYATLYRDLKTNLNTLRAEGLTKTQAMRGTLKEMADELLSYDIDSSLPNRLNGCNGDISCVNSEIDRLSAQLIIDNNETEFIVNAQKDNHSPMEVREVSCENELLLYDVEFEQDGTKGIKSYEYDENNRLIKIFVYRESPCHTYEYDSKGRHIRTLIQCNILGIDAKYKEEYSYDGNKLKEIKKYDYNEESQEYELYIKEIFSEWNDENKPKKIELITYGYDYYPYTHRSGEIDEKGTLYIDYTDGNPTYTKGNLRRYSSLDAETFGEQAADDIIDFEIRRTFDNKKLIFPKDSPLYYKHRSDAFWINIFENYVFRNNNILTEEIIINVVEGYPHKEYFEKYNIRYDYRYNSQNMPIEEVIHSTYTTNESGTERTSEEEDESYTYTYIEANKVEI